jgi:DNA-binding response OmpR family regulator
MFANAAEISPSQKQSWNHVVIVSSDISTSFVLEALLSAVGYDVVIAPNLMSLSERLLTTIPAAVLLDLHLSSGEAITILQKIKRERPQIPVITIAESSFERLGKRSVTSGGADDYLLKPLDFGRLHQQLQGVAGNSSFSSSLFNGEFLASAAGTTT